MDKIMDNYGVFDFIETPDGKFEYSSSEFRGYCAALIGNGVLKGAGGQFAATAAGLTITLASGEAWLLGAHGVMVDSTNYTLDPVMAGMSRICSIVTDVDAGTQQMGITILVGSQSATPAEPVLTQTPTRYQQLLYKARVYDNGTIVLSDYRTYVTRPGDDVDITRVGGLSFRDAQPALTDVDKARARSNASAAALIDGRHDPYEAAWGYNNAPVSRDISITDIGKLIRAGADIGGSNVVLTIRKNSTVPIPNGAWFMVRRASNYSVQIAAEAGVSLTSAGDRFKIAEKNGLIIIYQEGIDAWYIAGGMTL